MNEEIFKIVRLINSITDWSRPVRTYEWVGDVAC